MLSFLLVTKFQIIFHTKSLFLSETQHLSPDFNHSKKDENSGLSNNMYIAYSRSSHFLRADFPSEWFVALNIPRLNYTHMENCQWLKLLPLPFIPRFEQFSKIDGKCKMKMFLLNWIFTIWSQIHIWAKHAGQKHILERDSNAKLRFIESFYKGLCTPPPKQGELWRRFPSVVSLHSFSSLSCLSKLFCIANDETRIKDWQRRNNFVTINTSFISEVSPWWWRYFQYFSHRICMQSCLEIYKHLFWLYLRWGRTKKRSDLGNEGNSKNIRWTLKRMMNIWWRRFWRFLFWWGEMKSYWS